ncbi:hypothetical protein Daura_28205 [Dactylosporangium aurantiacum]|uniref:Uncharacterized protein n=1 Tax=Dactylosporangium aurantiacum TaxID=35754 RepID=A0A9Q9I7F6_9ACTN|nr:hypothetical protein [Dactylosporangium aurantiacum]MDG6106938.1 hypothetical protein [Dactylosporangium aurantiacum]UWZ50702.1 hypothetical protein Daura_28205 [Dactylosporangium aurantiacum]
MDQVFSVSGFQIGAAVAFAVANLALAVSWWRSTSPARQALRDGRRPGGFYRAVLLAYASDRDDVAVTARAALHRARAGDDQHPLTRLARRIGQFDDLVGDPDFRQAHDAEAKRLPPGAPAQLAEMSSEWFTVPAVFLCGLAVQFWMAIVLPDLLPRPEGAGSAVAAAGTTMWGAAGWLALFAGAAAGQTWLWRRAHRRWVRRLRARAAAVVRRGLGGDHEAFRLALLEPDVTTR